MFLDSAAIKTRFAEREAARMVSVGRRMAEALRGGGKLLFCGNGGSAADAQHLAAEFVNRFRRDRQAMAAVALSTDTSVLTSIGNDYGFERIFARQVEALGRPGDVLVAISTSGHSPNVLAAAQTARRLGLVTVAFVGGDGGSLAGAADEAFLVPSGETARIQETHITLGHALCAIVEDILAPPGADPGQPKP
jgi:D-sedoheptulose 7-phosphate isomerase